MRRVELDSMRGEDKKTSESSSSCEASAFRVMYSCECECVCVCAKRARRSASPMFVGADGRCSFAAYAQACACGHGHGSPAAILSRAALDSSLVPPASDVGVLVSAAHSHTSASAAHCTRHTQHCARRSREQSRPRSGCSRSRSSLPQEGHCELTALHTLAQFNCALRFSPSTRESVKGCTASAVPPIVKGASAMT